MSEITRIATRWMSARVRPHHISRLRGRREDGAGSQAVIDGEQSGQRHSWACVAATQRRGKIVVEGDCVGGRRGEGVGDADGEVLVPFPRVFVAEEVKLLGVKVPGRGHVESDTALLNVMLAMIKLRVARARTLTIS